MARYARRVRAAAQVTLSNEAGETNIQHSLRADPSELRYHHAAEQAPGEREHVLSAVLGGKGLMVFDVADPETIHNAVELSWQPSYGQIVNYEVRLAISL